jgi:transposase
MPVLPRNKDKYRLAFEKPDLNYLIDENSLPMRLYGLIGQLDFKEFYDKCSTVGAPSYPPEDMLSVIMLALSEGVYSSREIEKKCKRDIYYMFLTEQRKPDHATIARFIQRFGKEISSLGAQIIKLSREQKIATFDTIAIDGTKIASVSSKKHSMRSEQLDRHLKYLRSRVSKTIVRIQQTDKKERKEIYRLERERKNLELKISNTEKAKKELEKRKEQIKDKEHRENHQINIEEPDARMMQPISTNGYNAQISVDTKSGIIVTHDVVVSRSDNQEFVGQCQKSEAVLGKDENRIYVADSGYISENTFKYLEENKINGYINDSKEKEHPETIEELITKNKRLTPYNFRYDKKQNKIICPNQKYLEEISKDVYECQECENCPLIKLCCPGKRKNKRVTRTNYTCLREEMSEKVKENKEIMRQRKAVERSFAQMKWNLGMTRFGRKGLAGADLELCLMVLSMNMVKIITILHILMNIKRRIKKILVSWKDLIKNQIKGEYFENVLISPNMIF